MRRLIFLFLLGTPILSAAQAIIAIENDTYYRDENESNPNCPETVAPRVLNLGDGYRKVILAKDIDFKFKDEDETYRWSDDNCSYDADATTMLALAQDDSTVHIFQYRSYCKNPSDNRAKRFLYVFGAENHDQVSYEITNIEPNGDGNWRNKDDGQAYTCIWRRE